jgi:hypothetical protein
MTHKFAERAEPRGEDRSEGVERKLNAVREQLEKRAYNDRKQGVDRSEAIKQELRAVREQAEQLAKAGKREHAEKLVQQAEATEKLMQQAEAKARKSEAEARLQQAERSELIKQKLQGAREHIEQLQKQGNLEAAEKLMRETEAMTRKFQEDALRSRRTDESDIAQKKLLEIRERVNQLRKQGNPDAAEKLVQEADPLTHELAERLRAQRADQTLREKLLDHLHKQGDHEMAEKLLRKAEAEAIARKDKEQVDSARRDSSDDLRAGLRQLQRELHELRDQFRKLQEQRSTNPNQGAAPK